MTQPAADTLKLSHDAIIDLFVLDGTKIGMPEKIYFCNFEQTSGQNLKFQGNEHAAIPIKIEGLSLTCRGQQPTPTIEIGNVLRVISGVVKNYQDLVGAKFIRKKTFAKYLDNGISPDPTMEFIPQIWTIERKASETKLSVNFELTSILDRGVNSYLPNRLMLKNVCQWKYRDPLTCGYTGAPVADENDNRVSTYELDQCSQTNRGCELRFGKFGILRISGYIGLDES